MAISVLPAQDEDMLRLFTITSLAFLDNEPFWDAMYPDHHTEEGRKNGAERFVKIKNTDPHTHFMKAVDDQTGEIMGFSKWNIYKNHIPPPPGALDPRYWSTADEKDYTEAMIVEFLRDRNAHIKATNGNVVNLDLLVIDPEYQRKGVGAKLVEWGCTQADELGFEAIVESSVFGKGLYLKHGFKFQKDVVMKAPEKWAHKPKCKYAWLTREKQT